MSRMKSILEKNLILKSKKIPYYFLLNQENKASHDYMIAIHSKCGKPTLVCFNNLTKKANEGKTDNFCQVCGTRKKITSKRVAESINKHYDGNFRIISEGDKGSSKLEVQCMRCFNTFNKTARSLLRSCSCPDCDSYTKDKMQEELNQKFGEFVFKILDIFDKNETIAITKELTFEHLCTDGNFYTFKKSFRELINQTYGCQKCAGNLKLSKEDYIKRLKKVHGSEYEVISFNGLSEKAEIRHKVCGCVWHPNAGSLLYGHGCRDCFGTFLVSKEEIERLLFEKFGDEFSIVGEVHGMKEKVLFRHNCSDCGFSTFKATPYALLSGSKAGCDICHCSSKGENKISRTLKKLSISFEKQYRFSDCKNERTLPFDFFIRFCGKDYLIEYDGIQHFQPISYFGGIETFEAQKKRDKIKDDYCKEHNYTLLRIPYYDFDRIPEILTNFFSNEKRSAA